MSKFLTDEKCTSSDSPAPPEAPRNLENRTGEIPFRRTMTNPARMVSDTDSVEPSEKVSELPAGELSSKPKSPQSRKSRDPFRWLYLLPVFFVLAGLIYSAAEAANTTAKPAEFDHMSTGFPLRGAHERLTCETCHLRGIFKGTPNRCSGCHLRSTEMEASKKSPNHIPTTEECDVCHDAFLPNVSWQLVRMNHDGIVNNCESCHNGTFAIGKPPNHIPTNLPGM
jgi:hypothetical protein